MQSLQVGRGQLRPFLLPFGGHAQPVDATAADDQFRTELAGRQEKAVKRGIAQIFRFLRTVRPGDRERIQENFIGVADPDAGLWREPVEPAQPLRRHIEPQVFEDLWLLIGIMVGRIGLPIQTVPLPETAVALAPRL